MGQVGRALALIPFLFCALQKPELPPAAPKSQIAPRLAVAGIKSIDCSSTVTYAALPGVPHRLQSTYVFPDRARWWLGVGTEPAVRRQMRFRLGTSVWALDPEAQLSRPLEGEERAMSLVQVEMRKALFLWPEGFDWQRKDSSAKTKLDDLGTLTATFAEGNARNPIRLSFADAGGKPGDEYRAIEWRESEQGAEKHTPDKNTDKKVDRQADKQPVEKSWPTRLELWHEGALVWSETVDSLETGTRFIDSFFTPPDTRDGVGGRSVEVGAVRPLDLPETRTQRIALAQGTTWEKACAEHARLARERGAELQTHALKLDAFATFEVSDQLEPIAVILRLGPVREPFDSTLAQDWPLTPERPGLSTFVVGVPALEPRRLAALRQAVPPDAVSGAPYVRFDPAHPDQHVMVLLPLAPKAEAPPK